MVGIVIVSHSAKLAEGVIELAREVGGAEARLAAAGGLDLPGRPPGTDAVLVLAAIETVYSEDGVLVLMDLGSALLSAEMALEMLPAERRGRVRLCAAPLVEGAVSAAVQARLGSPLELVAREASLALAAKQQHLGTEEVETPASLFTEVSAEPAQQPTCELRLKVRNALGLHARPAARFVQIANQFRDTQIEVSNLTTGSRPQNAKSINRLATLGARQGHEILITAQGPAAVSAVRALEALAEEDFGDKAGQLFPIAPAGEERPIEAAEPGGWRGVAVSPGIAIGAARPFRVKLPEIPQQPGQEPQAEWQKLSQAIDRTRQGIELDRRTAAQRTNRYTAQIFDAHLLFLEDEALLEPAREGIFDMRMNAAAAWQGAVRQVTESYQRLEDPYQRARAADVADVGRQVLTHLLGSEEQPAELGQEGILTAADLSPAEVARLEPRLVLGICTAFGGATSHAAVLARSLGIPAIAGLGAKILDLKEGAQLLLDGESGQVWVDPPAELVEKYRQRAGTERAAQAAAWSGRLEPAVTRDGRRIEVAANIGSIAGARQAVQAGAESVGVLRTEFLFLDRQTPPDEEEQYQAYGAIGEGMQGRTVIIRTLDAGGDKLLPYLEMQAEANPFLGWRGLRLCLGQPELFKTQLRAIVRAGADHPVMVMFPMVTSLSEWREAVRLLDEAQQEVRRVGLPSAERMERGIMVEVPAAALLAEAFAKEVDFFSIGTNDLTQYTLAAERGNPRLAGLSDALHPAVLRLIRQVVEAAHRRGKWAGVCGEVAGEPLAAPVLAGLEVDELSMNAPAIPRVKQVIRELSHAEWREIASRLVEMESAEEVRREVKGRIPPHPSPSPLRGEG